VLMLASSSLLAGAGQSGLRSLAIGIGGGLGTLGAGVGIGAWLPDSSPMCSEDGSGHPHARCRR
jgi:hypothetical protein